jgi:hypothetical protein
MRKRVFGIAVTVFWLAVMAEAAPAWWPSCC